MARSALVLGAGGNSGTAWMAGVLAGFHDAGLRRIEADRMLGTSGGSIVAAVLAADGPLDTYYRDEMRRARERAAAGRQVVPVAGKSVEQVTGALMAAVAGLTDPYEIRRRVGKLALDEPTVPLPEFRAQMAAYLPYERWPARHFGAVAVDVHSGEPRVLDAGAGVDVATAIAAACSIPMINPVVTIDGSGYMDGGIRSNENLDLVGEVDRVLVLSPRGLKCPQAFGGESLDAEVEQIRRAGARVEVLQPEGEMLDLVCEHMLDTTASVQIAEAGREQGRRVAGSVAFLTGDGDAG